MAGTTLGPSDPLERASMRARSGLPLPDPFPDYVRCPNCGEPEVEVWCYQSRIQCHNCGEWIDYEVPACLGSSPICRAYLARTANPTAQSPPGDCDLE
jgi:hypothetical protein